MSWALAFLSHITYFSIVADGAPAVTYLQILRTNILCTVFEYLYVSICVCDMISRAT